MRGAPGSRAAEAAADEAAVVDVSAGGAAAGGVDPLSLSHAEAAERATAMSAKRRAGEALSICSRCSAGVMRCS